ncbi:uncharacterized protein B0J16DRAFT_320670 [Fusarium flagelliforme]|uniref:uncharacterized protein n=1 Tax=Fusarium flagelliforme TaxID=2675880 RepID=UPI001E8D6932|nr:uncharacterized protein B0J16DRAFT_320670 [Fusarium flagelliforme]KAH7185901.1 hypothetical protein B0J16DRAFT_320670 [Fusarium flagelliforme]
MAHLYNSATCVFCGVPATPPLGPSAEYIANGLIIDKGQWLSEGVPLSAAPLCQCIHFPQKGEYGQACAGVTLSPPCTSESSDPFYKLGPALILCIVDFLHMPDLCRLRKASRPCARLRLSFGFWRARLRQDMPFLYDFVAPKDVPLDWRLLYMVLDGMSSRSQSLARQRDLRGQTADIFNLPFKRQLALSNLNVLNITLLNRRRIWESIGQIIDNKADDDGGLNEWILRED